ncbi:MAG: transcriptional regulator NrdR [Candidatus Brocadiia bacterium]
MRCPFCSADDDKVIDSRTSDDGNAIRRRRECQACARRFTSYERIEEGPAFVIKKDGRREEFSWQKIYDGLAKACEKLPVSSENLEKVADRVVFTVREKAGHEVNTTDIGEAVIGELRKLDPVAYVRFISVYRSFKNVEEFYDALREVVESRHTDSKPVDEAKS